MSVSATGRWLALTPAADEGLIDIYDLVDGTLYRTLRSDPSASMGTQIHFSVDGSTVIASDGATEVLGWDLLTRRRIAQIRILNPLSIAVAPDMSCIAIATQRGSSPELRSWPGGDLIRTLEVADQLSPICALAFTADGKRIVGCSPDRCAMWNLIDGSLANVNAAQPDESEHVQFLSVSSDCEHGLRYMYRDSAVEIVRIKDGATIASMNLDEGFCNGTFIRGDTEVAIARECDQLEIQIVNAKNGVEVGRMSGHTEPLFRLTSSRDGSALVGTSASRVRVWDCVTRKLKAYCSGPSAVSNIEFSPLGDIVASTGPIVEVRSCGGKKADHISRCFDGVRFWNSSTGQLLNRLENVAFGGFSADGRSAWLWSQVGDVQRLDVGNQVITNQYRVILDKQNHVSMTDRPRLANEHRVEIRRFRHLPEQMTMSACVGTTMVPQESSGDAIVVLGNAWGDRNGVPHLPKPPISNAIKAFPGIVDDIGVSTTGDLLGFRYSWIDDTIAAQTGRKSSIGIWKREAPPQTVWLESPSKAFGKFALTADGTHIIAITAGSTDYDAICDRVMFWHAASGRLIRQWRIDHVATIASNSQIAISSDMNLFAIGCSDGRVRVWRADDDNPMPTIVLTAHNGPVTALAFAPDNRRLASGGMDSNLILHDLRDHIVTGRASK
ncbi:MAG: WD40 repeat domain-containing protein [Planctomycetes bacterium]|nr:WD40 repeat domain-containing protein [Planctomycetota bacterium]